MKFNGEMRLVFVGDPIGLEDRLDLVMEQLLAIEAVDDTIEDPDITASLVSGEVTVTMFLDAEDLASAAPKLVATTRAAIHAVGDRTPGWEAYLRSVREEGIGVQPANGHELAEA